ncbi:uncharacterized protein LOC112041951, partial [Lingula anatina]|uniref:Uncharacterized protein LOC112041951 n=1 Tax=Lingula anatina TaxID=7574 RepID=A0A2R2MMU5_LINAN
MAQDAVEVRSVYKRYGSKRNGVQALQDCSLTVPQGCIYGLLGPSGSGKTTLLRALVGRLAVDAGHVTVLGQKPGARGHEVPGKLIGYMPQ